MELNKKQKEKARQQFEENIKNVEEEDVEYAAKKGKKIIDSMDNDPPGPLLKLWEDVKMMVSMLGDYVARNYTETPWKTIAAIAGAIAYFVMPVDAIPDFIPVAGYLDDSLVITLAVDFARDDLKAYKVWKEANTTI